MSPIHIFAIVLLAAASMESKSIDPNRKNAFLDMVNKIGTPEARTATGATPNMCGWCIDVMDMVAEMIGLGFTHEEIIMELTAMCTEISITSPVMAEACFSLVDDLDKMLDIIINTGYPPRNVCCEIYHACNDYDCHPTNTPTTTSWPTTTWWTTYGR